MKLAKIWMEAFQANWNDNIIGINYIVGVCVFLCGWVRTCKIVSLSIYTQKYVHRRYTQANHPPSILRFVATEKFYEILSPHIDIGDGSARQQPKKNRNPNNKHSYAKSKQIIKQAYDAKLRRKPANKL